MFKGRCADKELLDQDEIPDVDLFQNLKELDVINRLLGGYSITLNALKKIIKTNQSYTLIDIGSGGGDTLKTISQWSRNKGLTLSLYGLDLKTACVAYANTNKPNADIQFICDDYRNIGQHLPTVDIIHASLFCHHLSDEEIVGLILFAREIQATLVINDLERNRLAYYAIKLLTSCFSNSYLVKNDAPLSVRRGFKLKDWKAILQRANCTSYSLQYKWAFRHQLIIYAA